MLNIKEKSPSRDIAIVTSKKLSQVPAQKN